MKALLKMTTLAVGAALVAPTAWAECSPDFSGVEITATTQTGPYIASALQTAAEGWQAKTCGTVKVVEFPWSELYPKIVTTLTSGSDSFDAIAFAPAWAPDFTPFLSEMPAKYQEGEDWEDIAPVYREALMVWNGKVLSQTMDGDVHTYTYRIDLFEDEANKAGFKKDYGYDLAVPPTWKEYLDIAEYFQNNVDGVWGTAEAFRRGGQQFWFLFSHAAAYTTHPDLPGSMFFDPDTMDAQINNPGWLRGLEEYIRASKLAPPSALNFSFGEVNAAFAGGQVAESIGWGDTGVIGADPEQSKVAGNVGSAVLPSSKEVYNYKTGEWDEYDEVLNTSFMAFGGWQAAVPLSSTKQEAAWDFIAYLTSPEVSGEAAVTGGTGVNPYRISHTTNLDRWSSIFSERESEEYLGAQRDSITADNISLDMRLPGYFSYTEILEIELSKALSGDVTAQEALDTVATGWNELTDDLGREEQLTAYRSAMGLD